MGELVREDEGSGRPAARLRGELQSATVLLDDAHGHRDPQADAAAFGPGGEERLADAASDLVAHAAAVISDDDARFLLIGGDRDADRASCGWEGLDGIQEQIHARLHQAARRGEGCAQPQRQVAYQLQPGAAQGMLDQAQRGLRDGGDVDSGE